MRKRLLRDIDISAKKGREEERSRLKKIDDGKRAKKWKKLISRKTRTELSRRSNMIYLHPTARGEIMRD